MAASPLGPRLLWLLLPLALGASAAAFPLLPPCAARAINAAYSPFTCGVLVFRHIPKNGGSTLRESIRRSAQTCEFDAPHVYAGCMRMLKDAERALARARTDATVADPAERERARLMRVFNLTAHGVPARACVGGSGSRGLFPRLVVESHEEWAKWNTWSRRALPALRLTWPPPACAVRVFTMVRDPTAAFLSRFVFYPKYRKNWDVVDALRSCVEGGADRPAGYQLCPLQAEYAFGTYLREARAQAAQAAAAAAAPRAALSPDHTRTDGAGGRREYDAREEAARVRPAAVAIGAAAAPATAAPPAPPHGRRASATPVSRALDAASSQLTAWEAASRDWLRTEQDSGRLLTLVFERYAESVLVLQLETGLPVAARPILAPPERVSKHPLAKGNTSAQLSAALAAQPVLRAAWGRYTALDTWWRADASARLDARVARPLLAPLADGRPLPPPACPVPADLTVGSLARAAEAEPAAARSLAWAATDGDRRAALERRQPVEEIRQPALRLLNELTLARCPRFGTRRSEHRMSSSGAERLPRCEDVGGRTAAHHSMQS